MTYRSSSDLLGEFLIRVTELAVVVGGGVLMVSTQTLDLVGMAGLVMLCATWAVLGSAIGALQIEGPRSDRLTVRQRRLEARHLSSDRGRLSFPPGEGTLGLAPEPGQVALIPATSEPSSRLPDAPP